MLEIDLERNERVEKETRERYNERQKESKEDKCVRKGRQHATDASLREQVYFFLFTTISV